MSQPRRHEVRPRRARPNLLELEPRLTPALIEPVSDPTLSPYRKVVEITVVYDAQSPGQTGYGEIDSGDDVYVGSGVMIGDNAVLTAAHVVYENATDGGKGWYDWAFVTPALDGEYGRPYGQAQVVNATTPSQYTSGQYPPEQYDIAVLELDRNLGRVTGTLPYGHLSDGQMAQLGAEGIAHNNIDSIAGFLPDWARDGVADAYHGAVQYGNDIVDGISGLFGLGLTGSADASFADLRTIQYPADEGYDGYAQQQAYANESDGPVVGYDPYLIYVNMQQMWSAHGSSGCPLLAQGYTVDGGPVRDLVIGVLHGGSDAAVGDDGVDQYTRIDDDYMDFIARAVDQMSDPDDKAELVDTRGWTDDSEGPVTTLNKQETDRTHVKIQVSNVGLAAAENVAVEFALSTNNRFSNADTYLGTGHIARIDPFSTATLEIDLTFPYGTTGASGDYIVYKIDPDNDVPEYGTPYANYQYRNSDDIARPNDFAMGLNYGFEHGWRYNVSDGPSIGLELTGGSTPVSDSTTAEGLAGAAGTTAGTLATDKTPQSFADVMALLLSQSAGTGTGTTTGTGPAAPNPTVPTLPGTGTGTGPAAPDPTIPTLPGTGTTTGTGPAAPNPTVPTLPGGGTGVPVSGASSPTAVRIGARQFAVGRGPGDAGPVRLFNPDGTELFSVDAFPGYTGGVRTAAADFNGDGVADIVAGTGPGGASHVRVLDGVDGHELFSVDPFEASFTGGVFVAAGDVNGDGVPDLVITPDEGGGPRVRVFDGTTFALVADFFGIDDPNFRGGARAAVGDIDGDGAGDVLVAAGFGGGPRVAGFGGRSVGAGTPAHLFADFLAFEDTLRNGTYVAAGDVDGDGKADVVAGGGPGGGPRVSVFGGSDLLIGTQTRTADYFAGDSSDRSGVRVAVKDLDSDGEADVVTGTGSHVTAYPGKNVAPGGTLASAFDIDAAPGMSGGVYVG